MPFDRLLVALGRRPRTAGLGLDAAGVRTDERGYVVVDDTLRTSNRRILSAGDVSGLPQFTHTAGVNGSIAATNAILGLRRTIDRDAVPRVTFTHPEVGAVGLAARRGRRAGLHRERGAPQPHRPRDRPARASHRLADALAAPARTDVG